jgi:hypothetical protein
VAHDLGQGLDRRALIQNGLVSCRLSACGTGCRPGQIGMFRTWPVHSLASRPVLHCPAHGQFSYNDVTLNRSHRIGLWQICSSPRFRMGVVAASRYCRTIESRLPGSRDLSSNHVPLGQPISSTEVRRLQQTQTRNETIRPRLRPTAFLRCEEGPFYRGLPCANCRLTPAQHGLCCEAPPPFQCPLRS